MTLDYQDLLNAQLEQLRTEGRYRIFADISRSAASYPHAIWHAPDGSQQQVVIWCSNDYLGMGQHPVVINAMQRALTEVGAGAGGTRNIAGTAHYHVQLEELLSDWYQKPAALLFSSGYVANESILGSLGRVLPQCVILSDAHNHASMIAGIKASGAAKHIFRHNDVQHLESLLQNLPLEQPKIIAFESVYSMDGDVAPIAAICRLARQYNALTFLDEVHAVGMYGATGSGMAEAHGVLDQVDIIQGTFGKAIGVSGGFMAASAAIVDTVRSCAGPFIFTTAPPPCVAAGAYASIQYLQQHPEMRQQLQARAQQLRGRLTSAGLPVLQNRSHIVPLMVRHAACCRRAADMLQQQYGIYVQPINYPTVPRGSERFRLTPGVRHTDAMQQQLVEALQAVWQAHALEQDLQVG